MTLQEIGRAHYLIPIALDVDPSAPPYNRHGERMTVSMSLFPLVKGVDTSIRRHDGWGQPKSLHQRRLVLYAEKHGALWIDKFGQYLQGEA
ncbi:MAG TPA: hypothetical protein VH023_11640, partial [Rhodopila sp.]|nr:hypothetical protein [Rhodopila sp.]